MSRVIRGRLFRLTGLGASDRGSATLELAILTPLMLATVALVVLAGRVAVTGNTVTTVAGNAAREASLAHSAGAAAASATSSARSALAAQAINCEGGGTVSVDTSGFAAAVNGLPGQVVTVTVTCVVPISDLGLPGAPGTRTLSDQAVSPIDPNRSGSGG